ncbi:MAG TPA: hypothetical protein VFV38_52560 [Ktedonobacteraceae bacterium]|nr:hypothetical protein [Ktedonobacteraceae bacterium]
MEHEILFPVGSRAQEVEHYDGACGEHCPDGEKQKHERFEVGAARRRTVLGNRWGGVPRREMHSEHDETGCAGNEHDEHRHQSHEGKTATSHLSARWSMGRGRTATKGREARIDSAEAGTTRTNRQLGVDPTVVMLPGTTAL